MDAVGADLECELDVVVDDERHAAGAAKREERPCLIGTGLLLAPVLEEGDAALEGARDLVDDLAALGRNGVQPAQLHCLKNRCGMNWPSLGRKPACSACQV